MAPVFVKLTEKVHALTQDAFPPFFGRRVSCVAVYLLDSFQVVSRMISNQQSLNLSPYMEIYDIVGPKDNILRQINDLVDFSFVHKELQNKYCLDNGHNAVPPMRMFKYLLLNRFLICLMWMSTGMMQHLPRV